MDTFAPFFHSQLWLHLQTQKLPNIPIYIPRPNMEKCMSINLISYLRLNRKFPFISVQRGWQPERHNSREKNKRIEKKLLQTVRCRHKILILSSGYLMDEVINSLQKIDFLPVGSYLEMQ